MSTQNKNLTQFSTQEILNMLFDPNGNSLNTTLMPLSKVVTFGAANGDGKIAAAKATVSTALTGANNDIDYTAHANGSAGNSTTVAYVDPGAESAALAVSVLGQAITVSLATRAKAAAAITTALTGSNNDFVLTRKVKGTPGNSYTLTLVDPGVVKHPLSVGLTGTDISISLQTSLTGTAATAVLTSDNTNITALDTVTVNTTVYTFVTALTEAAATATLTSDNTNVADGDTVTIRATVYRFKTTIAQANDIHIGADADTSLGNLVAAINATGTRGTDYHTNTLKNVDVSAAAVSSHATVLTATTKGTLPNAYATTETSAHLSFGGATMSGGANSVANEIFRGADADTSLGNLVAAINLAAGKGTKYSTATVVNPDVSAGAVTAHATTLTAKKVGNAANAYATTETSSHLSFGGSVMASGANTILTTAQNILDLINIKSFTMSALVTATLAAANDGTGVVTAMTQTSFSGGHDAEITTIASDIATAVAALPAAAALVDTANHSGNDGTGVVTAMTATALTGGADGFTTLFNVHGTNKVALVAVSNLTPVGASGTIVAGITGATTLFHASLVATTITTRKSVDSTGLVTAGAAVATTPLMTLFDGENIILTPGTANLTAGSLTYLCYYYPLTPGSYIAAA